MKRFLEGVPIPMAGVALGFTALGNLLLAYSPYFKWICGIIAFILLILVVAKMIVCPKKVFCEEFKNPIISSVSATVFMTIMQLTTYVVKLPIPNIYIISEIIWFIALFCHCCLILYFSWKLIFQLRLHHIYPTVFVTYVGIIVAAITAPTFHMNVLGKAIFWFGFMMYAILFIIISWRYIRHEVEESSRPLFVLYAAPMSLSLTGYLAIMDHPNVMMMLIMELLAQVLYVLVLFQLPKLLKLPFYPSCAAFTFPMVITPFALQKEMQYFAANYSVNVSGIIALVVVVETSIAIGMVLYAFGHYIKFLINHFKTNCKFSDPKEMENL